MTVGELEHGRGTPMSSCELTEWRVYYQFKEADAELNAGSRAGGNGGGDMPDVMVPG